MVLAVDSLGSAAFRPAELSASGVAIMLACGQLASGLAPGSRRPKFVWSAGRKQGSVQDLYFRISATVRFHRLQADDK